MMAMEGVELRSEKLTQTMVVEIFLIVLHLIDRQYSLVQNENFEPADLARSGRNRGQLEQRSTRRVKPENDGDRNQCCRGCCCLRSVG